MTETCTFVYADGKQCGIRFGLRDGWCVNHDPARREVMQAARSRGGQTTARRLRGEFDTLADVRAELSRVYRDLARGQLTTEAAAERRAFLTEVKAVIIEEARHEIERRKLEEARLTRQALEASSRNGQMAR